MCIFEIIMDKFCAFPAEPGPCLQAWLLNVRAVAVLRIPSPPCRLINEPLKQSRAFHHSSSDQTPGHKTFTFLVVAQKDTGRDRHHNKLGDTFISFFVHKRPSKDKLILQSLSKSIQLTQLVRVCFLMKLQPIPVTHSFAFYLLPFLFPSLSPH